MIRSDITRPRPPRPRPRLVLTIVASKAEGES
jgi:hypothetical protein